MKKIKTIAFILLFGACGALALTGCANNAPAASPTPALGESPNAVPGTLPPESPAGIPLGTASPAVTP